MRYFLLILLISASSLYCTSPSSPNPTETTSLSLSDLVHQWEPLTTKMQHLQEDLTFALEQWEALTPDLQLPQEELTQFPTDVQAKLAACRQNFEAQGKELHAIQQNITETQSKWLRMSEVLEQLKKEEIEEERVEEIINTLAVEFEAIKARVSAWNNSTKDMQIQAQQTCQRFAQLSGRQNLAWIE